jgi:uncharacterized membrane protein YkgB
LRAPAGTLVASLFGVTTRAAVSYEPRTALESVGATVMRYGLVVILLWVGALKFTAYEAAGIEPLVANSPLLSWAYGLLGLQTLARLIGVIEIALGLLIASRPFAPRLSAAGSFGAIIMFLITLSFALTTPGVWQPGYGFPFLFGVPGQFLAKDLVLLGVAIWSAGEALRAAARQVEYAPSRSRIVFERERHA